MAPAFNTAFRPRRFAQLLLRDLAGGYRSMLVAMAAVAGTVLVVSTLTVLGQWLQHRPYGSADFHPAMIVSLLFGGGYVVTSLAFREARQNGQGIFYLTLPASSLEKFASKLLTTSVGYALGAVVFYTAVAAACEGINRLAFGFGNTFFNPFEPVVLRALVAYLVSQSVFLLGSVWWRKLAFVKTVLMLQVVVIGVALVVGIAARIVFREYIHGWQMDLSDLPGWENLSRQAALGVGPLATTWRVLRIVFCTATAPVCWLIGWLRLREIEA